MQCLAFLQGPLECTITQCICIVQLHLSKNHFRMLNLPSSSEFSLAIVSMPRMQNAISFVRRISFSNTSRGNNRLVTAFNIHSVEGSHPGHLYLKSYSSDRSQSLKVLHHNWKCPTWLKSVLLLHIPVPCIRCIKIFIFISHVFLFFIARLLGLLKDGIILKYYNVPATRLVFPWVWSTPKSFAMPKSAIFGFISPSNKMLLGLRSRWIILGRESSCR